MSRTKAIFNQNLDFLTQVVLRLELRTDLQGSDITMETATELNLPRQQQLPLQLSVNHCTPHGDLAAAGGTTLQSPDAHDPAFSFLGSWQ
jgi:hypothetical protein